MKSRSASGRESVARAGIRARIFQAVADIPRGHVASYGEIASRAGIVRGARLVGRALASCPDDLPWHRVLNAAGRIALPAGSAGFRTQVSRLRGEGIPVDRGRIPRQLWRALSQATPLDAALWGPAAGSVYRGRQRP